MGSNTTKSSYNFSSEITCQILMKLGHNNHIEVGSESIIKKGLIPQRAEGQGQMGSNSAKSSKDFFSENTGQILMKLCHNDHPVLGSNRRLDTKTL